MRGLQFLVGFMGILIVAGIALLIYGIATGLHGKTQSSTPHHTSQQMPATFNDYTLMLEANQTVVDYHIQDGRLILYVHTGVKGQEWIVFDPGTGQHLGTIHARYK